MDKYGFIIVLEPSMSDSDFPIEKIYSRAGNAVAGKLKRWVDKGKIVHYTRVKITLEILPEIG